MGGFSSTVESMRPLNFRLAPPSTTAAMACSLGIALLCTLLPTRLEARDLEIDQGWLRIESRELTVLTNADADRGREIAAALQRFRAVFGRLAPALELNSPAPTTLLAFRDGDSYAPYKTVADRGASRILGQFISHPDSNFLTLDAGTELVSSLSVIHHEYVHYFVRNNFPAVPLWFNEGLAEYYSTFDSEGDTVLIGGAVDRHLAWLRRHGEFELSQVLAADTRSRSYHAPDQVGGFYAVSWLLVHYLLSGDGEQLERAADFFTLLQEGDEATAAFEDAFEIRLSTLQDVLRTYVTEGDFEATRIAVDDLPSADRLRVSRLTPPDANGYLGGLSTRIGHLDLAEDHFQRALDQRAEHAASLAGLALLRDAAGRVDEAELLYEDALQQGSSRPETFLDYGRHLLRRPQVTPTSDAAVRSAWIERGRWALEQALDLKGDYGQAWYLLGLSHGAGGDPETALRAMQRAHALMPSRLEVVGQLAQAYARLGRGEPARGLIEGLLRPRGEINEVVRIEDEVERLLLLHAAQVAYDDGDVERAIELLDEAVSYTRDADLRRQLEERLQALQALAARQSG